MTKGSLMKVESIAACSPWSILQYFWPALSDYWSWKPIFCLFESGRFTQALLYVLFFSPMNFGCCSESCQPASRSHVCRPALEGSCLGEIKCKYPFIENCSFFGSSEPWWRALWLSGRVLDSRLKGCNLSLVEGTELCLWAGHIILCISTCLTEEDPSWHDLKIVDWDVNNQNN